MVIKNNSRPNENSLIVKLQLIITKAVNLVIAKARMFNRFSEHCKNDFSIILE